MQQNKKFSVLIIGKILIATIFMLIIQFNNLFAMAPQMGSGQSGKGGGLQGMLMLFVPLLLIWWFLLIRPQQKREKDRKKMMGDLKKGEDVITIGGMYGKIVQVKEDRVILKISDKTEVEFSKSAISGKVPIK